jgi:hypothetical protein
MLLKVQLTNELEELILKGSEGMPGNAYKCKTIFRRVYNCCACFKEIIILWFFLQFLSPFSAGKGFQESAGEKDTKHSFHEFV